MPIQQPYVHLLRLNAGMMICFAALCLANYWLESTEFGLLCILFACACFLVEVVLCLVAAANKRWLLAAIYALLSIALFYADGWLLEQAE